MKSSRTYATPVLEPKNRGKLILDATCAPIDMGATLLVRWGVELRQVLEEVEG